MQVLVQRAEEEVALLPFASEAAAHAAIDARNARFRLSIPWVPAGGDASPDRDSVGGEGEGPYSPGTISERLVKAEKAAEQFVARRLQPAVQRTAGLVKETSPEGVVQGLKSSERRPALRSCCLRGAAHVHCGTWSVMAVLLLLPPELRALLLLLLLLLQARARPSR